MRKFSPKAYAGMEVPPNQPVVGTDVPPNQPIIEEPVSPPANTTVPSTPAAPVAPITSNATGQVPAPQVDPLLAANKKYLELGYRPGKARRMAMKEVNPTGRQKVKIGDVMQGINTGLDLVNKGTNVAGAISNIVNKEYGGAKKSRFQAGGGVMSGKELRMKKGFESGGEMGGKSGNLKKQTRKSNRAAKAYGKAASSYSKGNMKKGDRQMKRGNRISGRR